MHRTHPYDVILLDLQMPVMDGFQVMDVLKTVAADAYLPVIVLTAQPGHKLRALKAGAKDFSQQRPFDLMEVRTRIRNVLEVRLLYKKLKRTAAGLRPPCLSERPSSARARLVPQPHGAGFRLVLEQNEAGAYTRTSGPVLDMLGIQVEPFLAGTTSGQTSAGTSQSGPRCLMMIAERQPFLDFKVSRIDPDGTLHQFQVSGEPMFSQACRFIGYRGIGVELTGSN